MVVSKKSFNIPKNIESYLAALSKVYAQEKDLELQKIIVNSKVRVDEEWSYDNWNGGIYGHAVYFTVPPSIYPLSIEQKNEFSVSNKRRFRQHARREG